MEFQAKYHIGNIPPKKLLHYVTKAQLIEALGRERFTVLQDRARQMGQKMTAPFLKGETAKDFVFVDQLRNSPLGQQALAKYVQNSARLSNPAVRAKSQQVRREMAEPRRGFTGCIATKVKPEDYADCVENYDNPEFQSISLVPSAALKQSAYTKTKSEVLAPTRPGAHIRYLPQGLRTYIRHYPEKYADYLEELRAQAEYMKSVRQNLRKEAEEQEEVVRGKRVRVQGFGEEEWLF